VKDAELDILGQSFEEQCMLEAKVKARMEERAIEKLNYLQAIGHSMAYAISD
jgi:hypothetical protein